MKCKVLKQKSFRRKCKGKSWLMQIEMALQLLNYMICELHAAQ